MVTVWLSVGPSVVAKDQLHVPLLLPPPVTVPIDALRLTLLSLSGSAKAPVLAAVTPSSTVRVALSLLTVGGRLVSVTVQVKLLLLLALCVSVADTVTL